MKKFIAFLCLAMFIGIRAHSQEKDRKHYQEHNKKLYKAKQKYKKDTTGQSKEKLKSLLTAEQKEKLKRKDEPRRGVTNMPNERTVKQ